MQDETAIGKRIREIRNEHHLTQKEFGECLGVSPSYVSKLEAGKESPSGVLTRLMFVRFGISMGWLLEGRGPKQVPIEFKFLELQQIYGNSPGGGKGGDSAQLLSLCLEQRKGLDPTEWLREFEDPSNLAKLDATQLQTWKMAKLFREVYLAWSEADTDHRGWIYVQLLNALPEIAEAVKMKTGTFV